MSHNYIDQLKPGVFINDVYMVSQPVLRNTTRGDFYIAMYLSDKTGKANCRMWSTTEEIYNSIPKEGFVRVNGKTEMYQNTLQIVVNQVEVVDVAHVNVADFLPATDKDVSVLFNEVVRMLGEIKHPYVKALIQEYLSDDELMDMFRRSPAAVKMHHAFLGGLLEHTHGMLQVALRILPLYPQVQADLVIAGIFLHDLCKTTELSYDLAFSYTNQGQLVGHLVRAAILLDQKADRIIDKGYPLNQEIIDNITHILLSHHGKYEFGSPKLPATLEAIMVSYIDDMDAKLNFANDAIENEPSPDDWTPWKNLNMQAGTKFYKKKATREI
ncbi:MAG: 3'-5' exoribonuclease YhaM family protein [Phycisphaerae bacterium]|jgi:3'-5' exoribonuclease